MCVHVHLPLYTHSFSFFSSLILLSLVRQTHGAGLCSASPGSLQDLFYDAYRDEKSLGRNNALQVNKSGWPSGLRSYLIRMAKRSKTHSFFYLQLVVERSKAGFPAVISQTDTLDDDVDANVLMRRIIRKACVIGQEAGERRGVRLETPSGFSMVSLWYSSVIVAKKHGLIHGKFVTNVV